MGDWISVCDELPMLGDQVIAWAEKGGNQVPDLMLQVGFSGKDHWIYGYHNNNMNGVTHWMPLPEPPE